MIIDNIENKRKILAKFLEICVFEGVSEETLEKALEFCDISAKFKNLIFENGILDLIEFYIEENNLKIGFLINEKKDFSELKIREKIKFSLYSLFEIQKENRLALARIKNFYFDIKNFTKINYGARPIILAMKNALKISDFIWFAIGDKSSDFNFYTKRLTLAKIIIRCFFIFLKDESDNLEKTKKSIDLEIEKVMKFEKFKSKIKNCAKPLKSGVKEFFINEKGELKNPKEIIKNLPFFRLF